MVRSRLRSWAAAVAFALVVSGGVAAWVRMTSGQRAEQESGAETDTDSDSAQEQEPDTDTEDEPTTSHDAPPRGPAQEPAANDATASASTGGDPTTAALPTTRRPPRHTADPCGPVLPVHLPEDAASVTALGVTVTWPSGDPPIAETTAFAYLVAGLLEEAALLTGTTRREHVTVVVYPTEELFHQLSGAPAWADGLYSSAVHVPVSSRGDFDVRLTTLRHELMHAQLHSAVGCMPVWFNEGLASRFGGRPPRRAWLRMLRERQLIDFQTLEASSVDEASRGNVDIVYAQGLAMVLLLEERSPGDAIEDAVADLIARRGQPRSEVARLWSRRAPGVSERDVLSALSQRILGMPTGPALERQFRDNAACCYGTTKIQTFGCRWAPKQPDKHAWLDDSRLPYAHCEVE